MLKFNDIGLVLPDDFVGFLERLDYADEVLSSTEELDNITIEREQVLVTQNIVLNLCKFHIKEDTKQIIELVKDTKSHYYFIAGDPSKLMQSIALNIIIQDIKAK